MAGSRGGRAAWPAAATGLVLAAALAGCGSPSASGGWRQVAELKASDTLSGDSLGDAAAISGRTVIVGALDHDSKAGAAYVFDASPTGARQVTELTGHDTISFDELGAAVAISGPTAIVGSQDHASSAGRAYVFADGAAGWHESAELRSTDIATYDQFGASVALGGSVAVVGAPGHDLRAGRVYVFVRAASGWTQSAELKGSDTALNDEFGASVALSGRTLVVGAPYHAGASGSAYVFADGATGWRQVAELRARDGAVDDYFGDAVAISGDTVVVGAEDHASGAGRAYVFTASSSGWHQVAELKGSDTAADDYFGDAVAIAGKTIAVGAEYHGGNAGRVYLFAASSSGWHQVAELVGSDTTTGDHFGSSVAIAGRTVVVGADNHDSGAGELYEFVHPGPEGG